MKREKPVVAVPVFYDLPDFLVNLSGPAPQHFLKMKVTLQIVDAEAAKRLDAELPRVLDAFQVFLRELGPRMSMARRACCASRKSFCGASISRSSRLGDGHSLQGSDRSVGQWAPPGKV